MEDNKLVKIVTQRRQPGQQLILKWNEWFPAVSMSFIQDNKAQSKPLLLDCHALDSLISTLNEARKTIMEVRRG